MVLWPYNQNPWSYRPKKNLHKQLDSGGNIAWVPPGHTSSFWCTRQNGTLEKHRPKITYIHSPTLEVTLSGLYLVTPLRFLSDKSEKKYFYFIFMQVCVILFTCMLACQSVSLSSCISVCACMHVWHAWSYNIKLHTFMLYIAIYIYYVQGYFQSLQHHCSIIILASLLARHFMSSAPSCCLVSSHSAVSP